MYYIVFLLMLISWKINNTIFFFDGDSLYEWSNRSTEIHELEGNTPIESPSHKEKHYVAYNHGVVPTSEGLRIELDNTEALPQRPQPNRIPSVWSYPPADYQYSTQLGSIDSNNDNNSYPLGSLSPTSSHLQENGIYSGSPYFHHRNIPIEKSNPTSFLTTVKNKVNKIYQKLENFENRLVEESIKRKNEEYLKERSMYYIKGKGWINKLDRQALHRLGYTVKDSKVIKLKSIPKNFLY